MVQLYMYNEKGEPMYDYYTIHGEPRRSRSSLFMSSSVTVGQRIQVSSALAYGGEYEVVEVERDEALVMRV